MSIITDLSLDRHSHMDTWKTGLDWHKEIVQAQDVQSGVPPTKPPLNQRPDASVPGWVNGTGISTKKGVVRTFDEYRAVLGCYYLVSW